MADIFLCYSEKDTERAKQVGQALHAFGWSVWWPELAGGEWSEEAIHEINAVECVVVLWSKPSIQVSIEVMADIAVRRDLFVQAILEDVDVPERFRGLPCANLTGWAGDTGAQGFRDLTQLIAPHIAVKPSGDVQSGPASVQAGPAPLRRVFLCYRRQDTQGHTGRLRDRLVTIYGKDAVFMDVDDVPYGVDFVHYIEGTLSRCAVMVVLIGPAWLTSADRKGRRRLDRQDDLVRGEIAAALRGRIPVIPVLVEDASIPDAEDLPDDIRALTRRTTIELTHRRWDFDVQQVMKAIEKFMDPGRQPTPEAPTSEPG
jgi:hypothetical protein